MSTAPKATPIYPGVIGNVAAERNEHLERRHELD